MISTIFARRANRGAAWLDKVMPGWFNRINTLRLDIAFTNCCVIGQLHGDYNEWKKGVSGDFALKHGLSVTHVKDKNWRKQTEAWREEIYARRRERPQYQMAA